MNIKKISVAVLAGAIIAGCGEKSDEPAKDETKAEIKKDATEIKKAAAEKKDPNEVVMTVNGKSITRGKLDADVEAIIKFAGDKIPAERVDDYRNMYRMQFLQGFMVENVLVAKAVELGYKTTDADRKERTEELMKQLARMPEAPKTIDEYLNKHPFGKERARKEFENGILIDKMIKGEAAKDGSVANKDYAAEAKKIIDGIVERNAKATKEAVSEADALKKIKELKAQLDKVPAKDLAAKFGELAEANSDCPSGKRAKGDLGPFTHGMMVKEFDEAAFKLPVGKVSEPVKTSYGYHLIMTTKKFPDVAAQGDKPAEPEKVQASHILIKCGAAETQPVPKAEEVIKYLKENDRRQFGQKFVMGLVEKATITACDEFKQLIPPKKNEVKENKPATVENPAKK